MTCPVCGAKCVCKNAGEMCCSCHHHKARTPLIAMVREIAHAAKVAENEPQREMFA